MQNKHKLVCADQSSLSVYADDLLSPHKWQMATKSVSESLLSIHKHRRQLAKP